MCKLHRLLASHDPSLLGLVVLILLPCFVYLPHHTCQERVINIYSFNMKNAIYKLVILFVLQYNYIIKGTQTMDSIEFSYKSMGTWLCLECTVVKTILTTTKLISVDWGAAKF